MAVEKELCTYQCQARGGGGGRATHGNLIVAYIPRAGILIGHRAFDLSILYSRREVNHLFMLILTFFLPGGGDFDIFLENVKTPTLCPNAPPPPPSGSTLIGALNSQVKYCLFRSYQLKLGIS